MTRWERVYFDLDNTLYDYEKAFELASKKVFHSLYPTIPVAPWFHSFKQACDQYWSDNEKGYLSRTSYQMIRFQQSVDSFGIKISDEAALSFEQWFKKKIPEFIELFDGVEQLLSYLSGRKIETGIISNGAFHQQMEKMKAVSLFGLIPVENILVSDKTGKMKPSVYMFEQVITRRSGNRTKSLYIGDAWDLDITAARQAGWNTIYLNGTESFPSTDDQLFYIAKNFKELYDKRQVLF